MSVIGYTRVGTQEQSLDLQNDALREAGCDLIFKDEGVPAIGRLRPGFERALGAMTTGDVFVVSTLDRAFRSLNNALGVLEQFEEWGVEFRCLTEAIDTTTPLGKCMYQVHNAFAELERNFIRERTIAGIQAARRLGAKIGRPRKLSQNQITQTRSRLRRGLYLTLAEIAGTLGVSTRTLSRALNQPSQEKGLKL